MIKGYFILLTSLLTANLTSPDAIYGGQISKHQDLKKAEHIIKILKNQNQRVINIVLRKMKWTHYSNYEDVRRRNKRCRKTMYELIH